MAQSIIRYQTVPVYNRHQIWGTPLQFRKSSRPN